eukprot:scaffold6475_cov108-Isochrysis_galbana.AAC.2
MPAVPTQPLACFRPPSLYLSLVALHRPFLFSRVRRRRRKVHPDRPRPGYLAHPVPRGLRHPRRLLPLPGRRAPLPALLGAIPGAAARPAPQPVVGRLRRHHPCGIVVGAVPVQPARAAHARGTGRSPPFPAVVGEAHASGRGVRPDTRVGRLPSGAPSGSSRRAGRHLPSASKLLRFPISWFLSPPLGVPPSCPPPLHTHSPLVPPLPPVIPPPHPPLAGARRCQAFRQVGRLPSPFQGAAPLPPPPARQPPRHGALRLGPASAPAPRHPAHRRRRHRRAPHAAPDPVLRHQPPPVPPPRHGSSLGIRTHRAPSRTLLRHHPGRRVPPLASPGRGRPRHQAALPADTPWPAALRHPLLFVPVDLQCRALLVGRLQPPRCREDRSPRRTHTRRRRPLRPPRPRRSRLCVRADRRRFPISGRRRAGPGGPVFFSGRRADPGLGLVALRHPRLLPQGARDGQQAAAAALHHHHARVAGGKNGGGEGGGGEGARGTRRRNPGQAPQRARHRADDLKGRRGGTERVAGGWRCRSAGPVLG